jgi:hypothetical protein
MVQIHERHSRTNQVQLRRPGPPAPRALNAPVEQLGAFLVVLPSGSQCTSPQTLHVNALDCASIRPVILRGPQLALRSWRRSLDCRLTCIQSEDRMSDISRDDILSWGISPLETGSFGESADLRAGASPNIGKCAISVAADAHITNIGTYLFARIDGLNRGDLVEVALSGSAAGSEFYYSIAEVTHNGQSLINNEQIIRASEPNWLSMATNGLFEVTEAGIVVFSVVLRKGDVSGQVKVFHLGLIAKVVGHRAP